VKEKGLREEKKKGGRGKVIVHLIPSQVFRFLREGKRGEKKGERSTNASLVHTSFSTTKKGGGGKRKNWGGEDKGSSNSDPSGKRRGVRGRENDDLSSSLAL